MSILLGVYSNFKYGKLEEFGGISLCIVRVGFVFCFFGVWLVFCIKERISKCWGFGSGVDLCKVNS